MSLCHVTSPHLAAVISLDTMDGESRPVHFLRNLNEESCGGDSIILLLAIVLEIWTGPPTWLASKMDTPSEKSPV